MSSRKQSNPPNGTRPRRAVGKPVTPLYGSGDYHSDARALLTESRAAVTAASKAVKALNQLRSVPNKKQIAKKLIKQFAGFGDYHGPPLAHNSLINPTDSYTGAEFTHQGRRGTRVTESEYVGDVHSGLLDSGSSVFTNVSRRLNPANQNLFPWLSRFASLYDQWEPLGIILEFRTTSSTYNGTSQALGVVMGAVDYDPSDAPYASKQEMENADYAISTVASSNFLMGIECAPNERPVKVLYTGTPPPGSSSAAASFYDLGNIQVATQGMSTYGTTLGELWIHYDIVFYKKQVVPSTIPVQNPLAFANLRTVVGDDSQYYTAFGSMDDYGVVANYARDDGVLTLKTGFYLLTLDIRRIPGPDAFSFDMVLPIDGSVNYLSDNAAYVGSEGSKYKAYCKIRATPGNNLLRGGIVSNSNIGHITYNLVTCDPRVEVE